MTSRRPRSPRWSTAKRWAVSFAAWLARDPDAPLGGERADAFGIRLFWKRNFYPSIGMVLNDLHARGLLEAGEYVIVIDW
jgi:hypothetical protein